MTPLRRKMIDAMQLRGFAVRTHRTYLDAVSQLARYYNRSPDRLTPVEIQAYFLYLAKEKQLSGASCRVYLNAIRFLYLHVLEQASFDVPFQIPKKAQRIPELLTVAEVTKLIAACTNRKHRMVLMTCYGCGLRVSEVVAIQLRHIDGERRLLRVEQGKGGKDRQIEMSQGLLHELWDYCRVFRPYQWLFSGRQPTVALGIDTAQRAFNTAKKAHGSTKLAAFTAYAMPTPPISSAPGWISAVCSSNWGIKIFAPPCAISIGSRMPKARPQAPIW